MIARRCQEKLFTPHARGSIQVNDRFIESTSIYPACAGINPMGMPLATPKKNLPRMRGDQPDCQINRHNALQFTPHARGSTYADPRRWFCSQIYPAGAGINPIRYASGSQSIDLPRMRGDQPASGTDRADMPAFTPHARGSPSAYCRLHDFQGFTPRVRGSTRLYFRVRLLV